MKQQLSPAATAALIAVTVLVIALIGWKVFVGGTAGTDNSFKPVPMPGAAPPAPGEKRGPGSHK